MDPLKPGEKTSEFEVNQSSGAWGNIAVLLGTIGPAGLSAFGNLSDTHKIIVIVCGALIAIFGLITKCMADVAYIRGRSELKAASLQAEAVVSPPKSLLLLFVLLPLLLIASGCSRTKEEADAQQLKRRALAQYVANTNAIHDAEQKAYVMSEKEHAETLLQQGLERLKEKAGPDGKVDPVAAKVWVQMLIRDRDAYIAKAHDNVAQIRVQISEADRDMYSALKLDELVERAAGQGIDIKTIQPFIDSILDIVKRK